MAAPEYLGGRNQAGFPIRRRPEGVDRITCWLRLEGSGEVSGVGLDWIALEDLTCSAQLQAQSQSQSQSPPAAR